MNNWKKIIIIIACICICCILELNTVAQAVTLKENIAATPKYQLAQTAVGYCTVSNSTGSGVKVKDTSDGEVIEILENNTQISLGVTDGRIGQKLLLLLKAMCRLNI